MDRFFSLFGKIVLGVLALAIILSTGYYIGQTKIIKHTIKPTPTPLIHEITKAKAETPSSPSPKTSLMPSQAPYSKTISGGLAKGTSFTTYTLQLPAGWTDKRETTPEIIDKITLSKDTYSVIIYQAAIGGGGCIYKGDPPAQMAQNFTDFVDISGNGGQFRRSWNTSNNTHISYAICQKANDNSYGSITQFGKIDVVSPDPADESILKEIDGIIASIKKE